MASDGANMVSELKKVVSCCLFRENRVLDQTETEDLYHFQGRYKSEEYVERM